MLRLLKEFAGPYQGLEKAKAGMLDRMEKLTDDERNRKPAPGEWSSLQVLEHVVVVEEWMAGINSDPPPPNARVQMRGRLFIKYAGRMMRSGRRIPTIPMSAPPDAPCYSEVVNRWSDARKVLEQKLRDVKPGSQFIPIALHPLAGPLNPAQVLDLLDAHLDYHIKHFPKFDR